MKMYKLTDFRKKKVVLVFFPAAESPVCTVEMCTFRDSLGELKDYGAEVIGVSIDGPFANKIFSKNHNLNFPLLSDYNRETIKDRKSTRLNSSHANISYAVFCLKKKKS